MDTQDQTANAMLSIFDGDGKPFTGDVLVRVHNASGQAAAPSDRKGPTIPIRVPFHDGIGDDYAVSVAAAGYKDAGCFFKANPKVLAEPQLLMLPSKPKAQFLRWEDFKIAHPLEAHFLAVGGAEVEAQTHYTSLANASPDLLACLLNLITAMQEIDLGNGKTPLDYFKAIRWDYRMAQDRFFGYVDPAIIPQVRAAAAEGLFCEEKNCATFHPGSTCSWKQIAFPVANVQLTFHENDKATIDGMECVMIEPDIDLYRELLEHGFAEVFPNLLTGGLTDPFAVYALRWTTERDDDGPAFDPGYEIA